MRKGAQERMVATSKLSAKGQVVIPAEIRKIMGLEEGDSVRYIINGDGEIKLVPIKRASVLDLFGSLQPTKPVSRDFAEMRDKMREAREEKYR
ncbi:AbrB/MazE/SpoVT family DNA-binding domain-containing protein [Brevibacillus fluminis]|uniref:AbrB/MazE/SpoVT family DNA-binding domain-containing protein n=1 Tax=Brevibacillus fluminis TaxID=511487 RepID=UPI003F8AED96